MRTIRQSLFGLSFPPTVHPSWPPGLNEVGNTPPKQGACGIVQSAKLIATSPGLCTDTCASSRRYSPNAATTQELLCRRSRGQTIVMGVQASFGLRIWLMGGAVDDI